MIEIDKLKDFSGILELVKLGKTGIYEFFFCRKELGVHHFLK